MELKKKVYETIKKYDMLKMGEENNVVLGFSGGPDSLTLFNVLLDLSLDNIKTNGKFGYDIKIHPVHVNHSLRGESANLDEEFCVNFSKELNLKYPNIVSECVVYKFDCNEYSKINYLTTEEAGRIVRYSTFKNIAKNLNNPVISVAQNANDQAETILFRIIRGTSINGLEGISYKRSEEGVDIIRPLLNISREEIEEYISKEKLNPRIDLTNNEEIYMRNRIRLSLIPMLKEYNPNIIETINRLGESVSPINSFLEEEAKKFLNDNPGEIKVDKLKDVSKALRYQIYLEKLKSIGMNENITKVHLDKIDSLLNPNNHKISTIELADNYRVIKEKKILSFIKLDKVKYILASGSPRRRELMKKISKEYTVVTSNIDERMIEEELEKENVSSSKFDLAKRMVEKLSLEKALDVFKNLDCPKDTIVIGADTTVSLSDEILGKPIDKEDAIRMLFKESLEPQVVFTGVTFVKYDKEIKTHTFVEETKVIFNPLDEVQKKNIIDYCNTDSPYDKAGAYGIQDESSALVKSYEGDFDNIVGFPVSRVKKELFKFMQGK